MHRAVLYRRPAAPHTHSDDDGRSWCCGPYPYTPVAPPQSDATTGALLDAATQDAWLASLPINERDAIVAPVLRFMTARGYTITPPAVVRGDRHQEREAR